MTVHVSDTLVSTDDLAVIVTVVPTVAPAATVTFPSLLTAATLSLLLVQFKPPTLLAL